MLWGELWEENECRNVGFEMKSTEAVLSKSTWCRLVRNAREIRGQELITACGTGHATRNAGSVDAAPAAKLVEAKSSRRGNSLLPLSDDGNMASQNECMHKCRHLKQRAALAVDA
jgi:hypothetical protein